MTPKEYVLRRDGDGNVLGCNFCGCNVPTVEPDSVPAQPDGSPARMCQICYTTDVGNVLRYSQSYDPPVVEVVRMLAQVGNLLLNKDQSP